MAGDNVNCIDVICGPTAAGKSAIALSLAADNPIAIVSADSRQIYRGFDVGTAKPSRGERETVPHYGVDIVEPEQRYSAAAWVDGATQWIADARAAGTTPVIVGGTGFYMRSLVDPLFEEPALDKTRRQQLAVYLDAFSTTELRRWCAQLDPERARLGRTQLLRALEIALLSGNRVSTLHVEAARTRGVTARYLLVEPGASLAARIAERVRRMIAEGWLEEVKRLSRDVPESAPAWNATGYRELHRWSKGECDVEEATDRIIISTRQYAKRQRTWFRHQLPAESVQTVNPDEPNAAEIIQKWWAKRRRAA